MSKVVLTFKRHEIEFEVRECAYLMARAQSAKSDAPEKDDNWLMDVFQASGQGQGGDELPTRYMNLAFRQCEHILKQWTGVDVESESTLDDTFGAPLEYSMYMTVPDDTAKVTIQYAKNLIHEYIVKRVLLGWCRLVAPEWEERIKYQCDDIEEKLKACLASGSGERDLFPYPFG